MRCTKRFANAIKIKAIIKINNSDKVENKTDNKNNNNLQTDGLAVCVCISGEKNKTEVYILDAIAFNISS